MTAQSIEHFLIPRFKVINTYPNSFYELHQILSLDYENLDDTLARIQFFSEYPHLFKLLEWWEDREDSDMPMYLRDITSDEVYVFLYRNSTNQEKLRVRLPDNTQSWEYVSYLSPITEAEYHNQLHINE